MYFTAIVSFLQFLVRTKTTLYFPLLPYIGMLLHRQSIGPSATSARQHEVFFLVPSYLFSYTYAINKALVQLEADVMDTTVTPQLSVLTDEIRQEIVSLGWRGFDPRRHRRHPEDSSTIASWTEPDGHVIDEYASDATERDLALMDDFHDVHDDEEDDEEEDGGEENVSSS